MSYVRHTIIDRSGETEGTRHYLPNVTAANYATVTGNTPVTQNVGSLRVALGAVCIGNFVRHSVVARSYRLNWVPATSEHSQRENKVLISCRSAAGRAYTIELPHVDRTLFGVAGSDQLDRTVVAWADWETHLITNFVDGYGDNFIIEDARFVGRNL